MTSDIVVRIPSGTAAASVYLPVMEKHTILGAKVVNAAIPGAEAKVSLNVGATKIGEATVASDAAAGDVTDVVMDSTLATRKTPIDGDTPLKVTGDGGQTTATSWDVVVRLDAHALTRD